MKINVLMENTASESCFFASHGLSFYIETDKNILFDMGPDESFMENAKLMGIDLKNTDFGVLSHGHYDHGGGLPEFLKKFPGKKVYVSSYAFGDFYVEKNGKLSFIGIDKSVEDKVVPAEDFLEISPNMFLFSNVEERKYFSLSNKVLMEKTERGTFEDLFRHEQNLVVKEGGKTVLFSGCAHSGVINIVEKAKNIMGKYPDFVFSGFHLYNPSTGDYEKRELIEAIGNYLKDTGIKFFTCHCTGKAAYDILKEILKNRIEYVSSGDVVEI